MTSLNLNSYSFTLLHSITEQYMSLQLRSVCVEASFVVGMEVKEVDKFRSTLTANVICSIHCVLLFTHTYWPPVGPYILTRLH